MVRPLDLETCLVATLVGLPIHALAAWLWYRAGWWKGYKRGADRAYLSAFDAGLSVGRGTTDRAEFWFNPLKVRSSEFSVNDQQQPGR